MRRLRADWRTLGTGILLILSGLAASAQDAPRLFAPAPNTPAQAPADARTIPVVRSTLSDVPLPTAPAPAPPPAIRAALVDAPPLRAAMPAANTPPPAPTARYAPQKIAFAGGVTAAFDQTYATLSGFRPLTLDIYQPRATGPLPLVVFIHGGGWNNGDSRHAAPFADFPAQLALVRNANGGGSISSGDFNGDGKSDILYQNTTTGAVEVDLMNGSKVASAADFNTTGLTAIGTGDFNGDGKSDILFQAANGSAVIWTMDGTSNTGSFTAAKPGNANQAYVVKGAEDIDGNGVSDILWQLNANTYATLENGAGVGTNTLVPATPATAFHLVASTGGG